MEAAVLNAPAGQRGRQRRRPAHGALRQGGQRIVHHVRQQIRQRRAHLIIHPAQPGHGRLSHPGGSLGQRAHQFARKARDQHGRQRTRHAEKQQHPQCGGRFSSQTNTALRHNPDEGLQHA